MMKHFLLLFFVFLISCDLGNKLDPTGKSYFVKFYGEDGDHEGVDFVALNDGSFILLGNHRMAGATLGQQIYLVKVDELGMVVWQRTFGFIGDDFARDIEMTLDGKIIIAAESEKGLNDRDVFIKRFSTDGVPLDSVRVSLKTLAGGESNEEVNSISIIQSGFIVSGSTTAVKTTKANDLKDAMHLRFNNSLALIDEKTGLWKNTSGLDDSDDVLIKMFEINASTYYGFGYTNTRRDNSTINRDYKYWAFSLGATGDPTNNGAELLDVMGSASEDEKLSDVILSPIQSGEGFVLNGVKKNASGENFSFIVKLQRDIFASGGVQEKSPTDLGNLARFGNTEEDLIKRTRMFALRSGGYFLLTNSNAASGDNLNISLIKLDNNFSVVWQEPVLFGGAGADFAGNVQELSDGRIMIIGTMTLGGVTGQTKMVCVKLNASGKVRD